MRNRWEDARLRGGGVNKEGEAGERDGERERGEDESGLR